MITCRQGFLLMSIMLFLLFSVIGEPYRNKTVDFREKRQINSLPLVFPYGAVFKFVIGLSMPIPVSEGIALGYGVNLQFQYQQFQNITELSQYYVIKTVAREERDLDVLHRADERLLFYKAITSLVETKGVNGNDCMLRAICEAAQYPVEEEGLVGEIIHILLTPDYGKSPFEKDLDWDEPIAVYKDAATAGRQMFSCPAIYSGCPEGEGFFELVSVLKDE